VELVGHQARKCIDLLGIDSRVATAYRPVEADVAAAAIASSATAMA
jgi:hypothetical protein